jgi:hypothetical protein
LAPYDAEPVATADREGHLHRSELDIFPVVGRLPVAKVQPRDVLDAIRAVEQRGALEIANRTKSFPGRA